MTTIGDNSTAAAKARTPTETRRASGECVGYVYETPEFDPAYLIFNGCDLLAHVRIWRKQRAGAHCMQARVQQLGKTT